jgi:hypothetical protein
MLPDPDSYVSPEPLYVRFMLASLLAWTVAYVLIIRRGWKDGATGMPMIALVSNFSWELIYSFVTPSPPPQRYVNIGWLLVDVGVAFVFLRTWRRDFPKLPPATFYFLLVSALVTAFSATLAIQADSAPIPGYPLGAGRAYSSFGMNAMMSLLYVFMLVRRGSSDGQSIYIAISKFLGTFVFIVAFEMHLGRPYTVGPENRLLPCMFAAICFWDVVYGVMLYRQLVREGQNPWRRL